jgi:hypothetical protein
MKSLPISRIKSFTLDKMPFFSRFSECFWGNPRKSTKTVSFSIARLEDKFALILWKNYAYRP